MGLLNGLMGHASQVDPQELSGELGNFLVEGETIGLGYKLVRDYFVSPTGV